MIDNGARQDRFKLNRIEQGLNTGESRSLHVTRLYVVPDAGHSDLEQSAPRLQHRKALGNKFPGEGVEHDIHALPVRQFQDLVGKIEAAGIEDLGDALCLQRRPFAPAGGAPDFRAGGLRDDASPVGSG